MTDASPQTFDCSVSPGDDMPLGAAQGPFVFYNAEEQQPVEVLAVRRTGSSVDLWGILAVASALVLTLALAATHQKRRAQETKFR